MKLLHPVHWLSWILVVLASLFCLLPDSTRNAIAGRIGYWQSRRSTRHHHIARKNLETCFPEMNDMAIDAMLEEYFVSQFQIFSQSPIMWWWPRSTIYKRVEVRGRAAVDALVEKGSSVAFLVGHSVALDFGLVAMAQYYPLHGIYKPYEDPVIDWVVKRTRNRFGGVTISRREGLRDIIRHQQAGKCLIYLGDEDLGKRGSVFVPFFKGRKATLTVLPRIARKCEAAVVPMYTHYDVKSRKFIVTLLPPIENYPIEAAAEDAEKCNARLMNKAIEETVNIYPTQYFWKLKFFKTTEDDSPNVYS